VVQRVSRAEVAVAGDPVGAIGAGLLVLVGVLRSDGPEDADRLADRTAALRVFADGRDRMNRSVADIGGALLVVSQFTLAADTRRGHRPSFEAAAPPERAEPLYDRFVARLRGRGLRVETGRFRAMMSVSLVGDGPVTVILDEPREAAPAPGGDA
jgi:D-tyrosyl-tRNA(Tyr) deacylase